MGENLSASAEETMGVGSDEKNWLLRLDVDVEGV